MSNDPLESEIEILRAQVAELTAARESENSNTDDKVQALKSDNEPPDVDVVSGNASANVNDISDNTKNNDNDLEHQFQELIDTIDTELKEASPITVLAVFAVGILVGRLLPR